MQNLPDALTERAAFLLQLALARARTMGEQALDPTGLSGREYGALAVLSSGAPTAQGRLGEALGVDRTSTVKLVGGLQARGLVTRVRDPGNRRAYRVTLTATGERERARAESLLADCDERFLEPLDADEQAMLRNLLRRLAIG